MRRFIPLLFIMLLPLLAACGAKFALPEAEVKQMRVTKIEISAKPKTISWPEASAKFARERGLKNTPSFNTHPEMSDPDPQYEKFLKRIRSPEGQKYLGNALAAKMKPYIKKELGKYLTGNRKVKLEIDIIQYVSTPAAAKLIINTAHSLSAKVKIIDIKTGKQLAKDITVTTISSSGFGGVIGTLIELAADSPADRLSAGFARQLRKIMLPGSRKQSGQAQG